VLGGGWCRFGFDIWFNRFDAEILKKIFDSSLLRTLQIWRNSFLEFGILASEIDLKNNKAPCIGRC